MNSGPERAAPSVSVVVTCYNYAKYLRTCLESIYAQTLPPLEVILVDDGSTDDTPGIAKEFSGRQGFTYLRQENSGQAKAKNVGIQHSRGEFVAFLDADDYWEVDKLERQMPLFADERVGVVYSRARFVDGDDNPLASEEPGKYLKPKSGMVTRDLFFDNFVPFSSSVVRKRCFDAAGGSFDESISMGIDWDLWLRISIRFRFGFVDAPLLYYRVGHSGQMSRQTELRQNCSDLIMAKFMRANPSSLPRFLIRRAMAYTYCNRGYYFRRIDPRKSYVNYMKALMQNPIEYKAIKGAIGTLLYNMGVRS